MCRYTIYEFPLVSSVFENGVFENGAAAFQMKEAEIEMILERAKEQYPEAKPRIISDNGPQFIARDFKEFIRISWPILSGPATYSPLELVLVGKMVPWSTSVTATLASGTTAPVPSLTTPTMLPMSFWAQPADVAAKTSNATTAAKMSAL